MNKILLNDEELVVRLKNGSNRAFEIIFRKYYSELFCFACTYMMNKQQSEDLVQDIFVNIWNNRVNLPSDVVLKNYLYGSVKNACYDIYRHFKVEDKHKEKLKEALRYSGFEEYCEEESHHENLFQNFSALSEQQKRIIEMKYVKGQSYKQIASSMGITENTVHTHVKRAYSILRRMFIFCLTVIN